MKKRGYSVVGKEETSAKEFYDEARTMAKRSIKYRTSADQSKVVKRYAASARGYEEEGELEEAKEVIEEAIKYLDSGGLPRDTRKMKENLYSRLDRIDEKLSSSKKGRGLEKNFVFMILTITSLVLALSFISFNFTGHAVGKVVPSSSSYMALGLLMLGLIFAFFHFKSRKKK